MALKALFGPLEAIFLSLPQQQKAFLVDQWVHHCLEHLGRRISVSGRVFSKLEQTLMPSWILTPNGWTDPLKNPKATGMMSNTVSNW